MTVTYEVAGLYLASYSLNRAEIVLQLAERSVLTPEIRGSNPSIGKIFNFIC